MSQEIPQKEMQNSDLAFTCYLCEQGHCAIYRLRNAACRFWECVKACHTLAATDYIHMIVTFGALPTLVQGRTQTDPLTWPAS